MFRSIAAIVLSKEVLPDGRLKIKVFSHSEGKLICIHTPSKRPKPIGAPALFTLEGLFKSRITFTAKSYSALETFFEPHHLRLHLFCLPLLDYYPYGEPSPFAFGRYLHALRKSADEESAKRNALWFAAGVLFREGYLPEEPWLREFILTKKTGVPEKLIWKTVKRGLRAIEGKG